MAKSNMTLKIYTVKTVNDIIVKIKEHGTEGSITMPAIAALDYMHRTSEQALKENIRIHWVFI